MNKNEHEGVLPDGVFDKNTKIFFCCRSDGRSNTPIKMPDDTPFVLYRYRGQCQTVANMKLKEDFIEWNNEFLWFNSDEKSGFYPDDDGGSMKHRLHYCHYS